MGEEHAGVEEAVVEQVGGFLSPGNRSVLSGTTAITSYSTKAVQELSSKRDELLELLPELSGRASDILRALTPIEATTAERIALNLEDLRAEGNKKFQRLTKLRPAFEEDFGEFAHRNHFIVRDVVLRSLAGESAYRTMGAGPGRPDDLIFKANLAELMYQLMVELAPEARFMFLQHLDGIFPRPFLSSVGADANEAGGSLLVQACFDAAVAIKMQLATTRLLLEPRQEPDIIIHDVFGLNLTDTAHATAKVWEQDVFAQADGTLPIQLENQFKECAATFQRFIIDGPDRLSIDVAALQEAESWPNFLHQMGVWAAARNDELDQYIARKGGPDKIVSNLRQGNLGRKPTKLVPGELARGGAKALNKIKARRSGARKSANAFHESNTAPEAQMQGGNDLQGALLQGDQANMFDESARAGKRRWIDSQPNATRVVFDESQVGNSAQPQHTGEVSDDGGFDDPSSSTAHGHQIAEHRRARATALADSRPSPGKRAMEFDQDGADDQMGDRTGRTPKRVRRQLETAGDGEYMPAQEPRVGGNLSDVRLDGTPPPTGFLETTARARIFTATQGRSKEPQRRKAWTTEETDALLWYVARYGSKWADIMKADNGLHFSDRSQVALKDKARNLIRNAYKYVMCRIRFAALKTDKSRRSGEPLPRGLEDYNLPENMKAELRDMGIDI